MSTVVELDHPVARHHTGLLRSTATESAAFRHHARALTIMLAVEATRELPEQPSVVQTPLEDVTTTCLTPDIAVVPILRAGLGMVEPVLDLIPLATIWHLGMYRDEDTAMPVSYYDKIPRETNIRTALIVDPMLATGGSAIMAINTLRDARITDIRLLSLIAAPQGIQAVQKMDSRVAIYAACIDRDLNDQNYILPGLGDAGDRIFNT